jgi:predicted  nucleic acid-binding Zn-ribbon protein
MLDSVRALLVLQDRDRRLASLRKDLAKLPHEEERARAKLSGDEQALAARQAVLTACELRLKELELDAATRRTTIQRLKIQQFETRKNDEYQALGHEISRYESEVDGLETKELELMEEIDARKAERKSAEEALAHTRSLVEEDLAAIRQRRASIEAEAAETQRERDALALAAPADLLPVYDRLLKTKDGLAVAPIHEGKCGGCHMRLIQSTVVAVNSGKDIVRCEDCGRILYIQE